MKVLDLSCRHGHVFEGWFASEDDFQSQKGRGLVQCPLCGDAQIEKRLSAPRLNLGAAAPAPAAPSAPAPSASTPSRQALQAAWLRASRELIAKTEDVGARFAEEARRMHQGEIEARGIRGQATLKEAAALLEEGIAIVPLPLAGGAKETLQ